MQLIARNSESHYYAYEHETGCIIPMYDVPNKSKGGTRSVTLADAKKQKLMVGISTIANMLPKPALQSWKLEKAIYAALTLPRLPDEPLDAFASRVVLDMDEQSNKAKEFGTRIHDGIEKILRGVSPEPDLEPWLAGFRKWADEWITEVRGLEQIVGDPALGIAGRLDVDCVLKQFGPSVLDAKTQRIKGSPTYYSEWLCQLSSYEHCRRREDNIQREVVSLVINTAEPGPVHPKVWLGQKAEGFRIFQHCLELWKWSNGYDPSQHESQL